MKYRYLARVQLGVAFGEKVDHLPECEGLLALRVGGLGLLPCVPEVVLSGLEPVDDFGDVVGKVLVLEHKQIAVQESLERVDHSRYPAK